MTLVFHWIGDHISLNDWYSGQHWNTRKKQADKWHKRFYNMLPTPIVPFRVYHITLEYNSRLDPSNTITMIKLCEDMMQSKGIIVNDNKNFCKGIAIYPNTSMKQKEYKITVNGEI